MYLLDWKIPKRLHKARDSLLEGYLDHTGVQLKNNQRDLLTKAIGCFVYNASYNIAQGVDVIDITLNSNSYSKPLIYNCNKVNRKVSYKYTKILLEWLEDASLIELHRGSVESWSNTPSRVAPKSTITSHVRLLPSLYEKLYPVSSIEVQDILKSVLEVRDNDGNSVIKRLCDKQRSLISLLDTYNTRAMHHSVELDGEDYFLQFKKVFNNKSWTQGGRTYTIGAKVSTELLRRDRRANITINKEPVGEVDYSHLHPSIIAELEGHTYPKGFDPYGITIGGYDSTCLRKIAKIGMLCLINSRSYQEAQRALNWEICNKLPIREWKESGLTPDPISSKLIIQAIHDHNQYAHGWFGSGRGLELQHYDSLMMDYCIDYWNQRDVMILTLYDSIILPKGLLEECEGVMMKAYQEVLGSKINCRVR